MQVDPLTRGRRMPSKLSPNRTAAWRDARDRGATHTRGWGKSIRVLKGEISPPTLIDVC